MRVQSDNKSLIRNQCSFLVRVDGEELEIPINFGMTADEIRQIYPYILSMAATKIENPAIIFANETKYGKYSDITDTEYADLLIKLKAQSKFWYDKPEASLLDIAIRFALDIKMKGIAELANIFETVSPIESIKAEPISDADADLIISRLNLETPTDHEHDAGEPALDPGQAGSNIVNIYDSTDADEYFSDELDKMTTKLSGDRFEKIISENIETHDASEYARPMTAEIPSEIRDMMHDDQTDESPSDTDVYGDPVGDYNMSDPSEQVDESSETPDEVPFADEAEFSGYDSDNYNDTPNDTPDDESDDE